MITEIGARLDIPADALESYGSTKAKVRSDFIKGLAEGFIGAVGVSHVLYRVVLSFYKYSSLSAS